MNTSQLGNIGEAKVLSEFVKLNIPCYLPYGDGNTIDLIAEFNGKLNRIQIKTTAAANNGAMMWKTTRQEGFHGNRATYDKNQIDYFAFYCLETDIVCLVPFDDDFPSNAITIRTDDYQGTRLSTMRFAKDFQISNFIHS